MIFLRSAPGFLHLFYPLGGMVITRPKEDSMDFIIAGIIAAALAGYLVYALLHPDKF